MFNSIQPIAIGMLLAALLSGALHIWADYKAKLKLTYLFKPLTLLLMLFVVIFYATDTPEMYLKLLVLGLTFSMFGDIFLMLEKEKFILGLSSFFIAHLCYIVAFSHYIIFDKAQIEWSLLVVFIVIASFIWQQLKSNLGSLKIAVAAYMSVIVLMSFSAGVWMLQSAGTNMAVSSVLAFIGAVIFMCSDTSLAINRFKKQYPWSQFLTLSTYYLAQTFFVLSALSF